MKFYFQDKQGNRRELSQEEVLEHMTPYQIREANEVKRRIDGEVVYTTVGGFIIVDLDPMEKDMVRAQREANLLEMKKLLEAHEKWKASHPRQKHRQKKEDAKQ